MGTFDDRQRAGRHGTDVPTYVAVQTVVTRLVWKKYDGWSAQDRQDLEQLVMVKYFGKFGRDRLPDDKDGNPAVPIPWLTTVVRNAGVDLHRQREARPADPVDFQDPDDFVLERLQQALDPQPSLASEVADRLDLVQALKPALAALAKSHPMDAKLIVWRLIQDRDLEEIATIVKKTPAATKKAIQRAVNRLKDLMTVASSSQ